MTMKRLSFLLLDANVVIYLFEHGLWERLIASCDVHLARTVIDEAHFYEDDDGRRHDFDVNEWEKDITIFDVTVADVEAFCNRFDASYMEKLDPGEAESLAWLVSLAQDARICSSDAIHRIRNQPPSHGLLDLAIPPPPISASKGVQTGYGNAPLRRPIWPSTAS
jgi:hypothetical protein